MNILDSLVELRKQQKIKQKIAAKHLEVNDDTMSRYEAKKRKMPHDLLVKYANYLGYEIRLLKK